MNLETSEGKNRITESLVPLIALAGDPVLQAHYRKELAHKLFLSEQVIHDLLRRASRKPALDASGQAFGAVAFSRSVVLEQRVLGLLLRFPETFDKHRDRLIPEAFSEEKHRRYLASILEDRADIAERDTLLFATEVDWPELSPTEAEAILADLLQDLFREDAKRKLRALSERLRAAEESENLSEKAKLMQEFANLSRKLSEFE